MAVCEILLLGHENLRKKCVQVSEAQQAVVDETILNLRDTLLNFKSEFGFGRAIAAPQINALVRIIYMNIEGKETILINPVLEPIGEETFNVWDDCFSFPGLEVYLNRYQKIRVSFNDQDWNPYTLEVEGDLAELIQHEYDHLDGILAVDRAKSTLAYRFNRNKLGMGKR